MCYLVAQKYKFTFYDCEKRFQKRLREVFRLFVFDFKIYQLVNDYGYDC